MATSATNDDSVTRRDFVKTSAAVTLGSLAAAGLAAHTAHAGGSDSIRVGLVGCGGRGTGAAHNALEASPRVRVVALADVFRDRLHGCRERLASFGERAEVTNDRCHVGLGSP